MQIKGHVQYSALLNEFSLIFWVEFNGGIVNTQLGNLNWQLYDMEGNIITDPQATGSGIAPLSNGLFPAGTIDEPNFIQNFNSYLIRVETTVNGGEYSTFIPFIITNL